MLSAPILLPLIDLFQSASRLSTHLPWSYVLFSTYSKENFFQLFRLFGNTIFTQSFTNFWEDIQLYTDSISLFFLPLLWSKKNKKDLIYSIFFFFIILFIAAYPLFSYLSNGLMGDSQKRWSYVLIFFILHFFLFSFQIFLKNEKI